MRKSKTPEVHPDAHAAVQPVAENVETSPQPAPREKDYNNPDDFPEWIARGRNGECIDAFKRLIGDGPASEFARSLSVRQRIAVGAALIAEEDADLTFPHEHFIAETLSDFADCTLNMESIEGALEEFQHGLKYTVRIAESWAKNTQRGEAEKAAEVN